jgi:hypothetical protein
VHGVSAPSDKSSSGGATVNGAGASSGGMTVQGYPSSSDSAEDNGAGVGIGAGRRPIENPTREELAATLQEISSYGTSASASGGGSSGGTSENPIVIDDDEAGGTGDYFGGGGSGDEVEDYGMGYDRDEDEYNYDDQDDFWVDEAEGPPVEDPDIDYDKVEYPDYDDLTDEQYYAARVDKMNAMIATARNYKESPNLSQQLRRYTPALHIREENQRIREVQAAKLAIDLLGPRSANASGLRGRMGRAFDTTYDITRHNVDEAVAAALAQANIEFDQEDPVLLATLGSGPRAPGYTRHLQALPPPPAPPPSTILGTAHAQHSGTMYDKKAFVFDMNPSDDDDDGDIPLVFRRR